VRLEECLARHGGAGALGFELLDVHPETGQRTRNLAHYARPVLPDYVQHALPGGRRERLALIRVRHHGQTPRFQLLQCRNQRRLVLTWNLYAQNPRKLAA